MLGLSPAESLSIARSRVGGAAPPGALAGAVAADLITAGTATLGSLLSSAGTIAGGLLASSAAAAAAASAGGSSAGPSAEGGGSAGSPPPAAVLGGGVAVGSSVASPSGLSFTLAK